MTAMFIKIRKSFSKTVEQTNYGTDNENNYPCFKASDIAARVMCVSESNKVSYLAGHKPLIFGCHQLPVNLKVSYWRCSAMCHMQASGKYSSNLLGMLF